MNRNPFRLNLRRAGFRKLNRLMSPALGAMHLLSVCTCPEKSQHPGPHHGSACPCYATHRVEILACNHVYESKDPTSPGHYRKSLKGPVQFHLRELHT
jgi:hypothetical protein